jgi:hypothetical protein
MNTQEFCDALQKSKFSMEALKCLHKYLKDTYYDNYEFSMEELEKSYEEFTFEQFQERFKDLPQFQWYNLTKRYFGEKNNILLIK